MPDPAIVPLEAGRLPEAADALARAFLADPLMAHAMPDQAVRVARTPTFFAAHLRYGLLFGEVWTTAEVPVGAAIWLPPGGWEVTPERAEASGLDLGALLGEEAAARFLQVMGVVEPFHRSDVPADHWYLMILGVAPEAQRRGLGRALVEPVMSRADAAGQSCYVETEQPANVPFYTHLGFRVVRELLDADSGLRLWTFRRDAARAG
ncbi:MAG: GNAT family N-acetyltransferase [Acidobacteriota bacterium]